MEREEDTESGPEVRAGCLGGRAELDVDVGIWGLGDAWLHNGLLEVVWGPAPSLPCCRRIYCTLRSLDTALSRLFQVEEVTSQNPRLSVKNFRKREPRGRCPFAVFTVLVIPPGIPPPRYFRGKAPAQRQKAGEGVSGGAFDTKGNKGTAGGGGRRRGRWAAAEGERATSSGKTTT